MNCMAYLAGLLYCLTVQNVSLLLAVLFQVCCSVCRMKLPAA